MPIGDRIKQARKRCGYTQQELADMLGLKKATICGYETGIREPDALKIHALSRALGVTGDWLLETPFAEQLDEQPEEAPLSEEATKVARDYDSLTPLGKSIVRGVLDTACTYLRQSGTPGTQGEDDPYAPEVRREIVTTKQLINKAAK